MRRGYSYIASSCWGRFALRMLLQDMPDSLLQRILLLGMTSLLLLQFSPLHLRVPHG